MLGLIAPLAMASAARAGDVPLYQPAPAWVVPASLPEATRLAGDSTATVIFDMQQRIEDGRLWSYFDGATRITSPEALAAMATMTLPWAPDKGDLIVHELTILRGGKQIDLIAQGQKFTVLRREEALEQRELTGILTATLAIEGLQVGDILRLRASTTAKDDALAGRVQSIAQILAAPAQVGTARMRFSWPTATAPRWKILAQGATAAPVRKGPYTELSFALPIAKQPEMPGDAPARYQHPPLIQLSTFADWADVSKVMAPLYETKGAIAPDGPIAAEVQAIQRAEAAPLGRAQRALELVQDKVRYLAVGMDGGNYIPQKPERTWEVRYGDCKAKTLLLLAMLHAMGIDAEPVLANISAGDFVPEHLPSAQAFDHVLVRATIGGETFWLDGTGSGSRLADVRDTPPFRHVLPVRPAGAELVKIETRANARPSMEIAVDADESASPDLPSVFDVTAVVRGPTAAMITLATSQLGEKEKREAVGQFFMGFLGQAQFSTASMAPDPASGSITLKAHGVTTSPWVTQERRLKRSLSRILAEFQFAPDRSRPAWKAIPVATSDPTGMRYRLRVRLADGGRGFTTEGEPNQRERLAGWEMSRTMRLEGGTATLDERVDSTGAEVAAAQVAGERDRAATAKARAPRIVAPDSAPRRWDLAGKDPPGATQIKAIEATLATAIANDPEEVSGFMSRASFRSGIGDRKGALADLGRAIAIEPSVALYLQRSALAYDVGDLAAAGADAEAARQLDPSSSDAIGRVSALKAERGDLPGAIALLDERAALGGDTSFAYRQEKAALIGQWGDAAEAMKLLDALIAEKPGSPSLLNERCWVKGSRSVMLDTALRDCTDSIELSSNTVEALDSRAMVWYRLGRYDEALRDLDAALAQSPRHASSRFMRAIVLARLDRDSEAAKELTIARRLEPSVEKSFARYGIKP
jgi:tetratricopeptide (TPR) repeat protein